VLQLCELMCGRLEADLLQTRGTLGMRRSA
jgi:hypothetical protein